MPVYISILRGINVSGHKLIKMESLRSMFSEMGFKNVRTDIQSGNVIFQYKQVNVQQLAELISKSIFKHFSFEVPVLVLGFEELKQLVLANPFLKEKSKDLAHLHVTYLSALPDPAALDKIMQARYGKDELLAMGKGIYLYCPNGYSNSKLTNGFFESKLKLTATTRNWKTTVELLHIAEEVNGL